MEIETMRKNGQLELLRQAHPINGLIHVGHCTSLTLDQYQDWQVPQALFFQAEEASFLRLEKLIVNTRNWSVYNNLIADSQTNCDFHVASNRAESSRIHPDHLKTIWPNLELIETVQQCSNSLSFFLPSKFNKEQLDKFNWLVVHELDSLSVLKGTENFLDQFDVVVCRTVGPIGTKEWLMHSSQEKLKEFMEDHRFGSVGDFNENHPDISWMIYLHDWRDETLLVIDSLREAKQEFKQREIDLASQITAIKAKNQNLSENIEKISQEKSGIENKHTALESKLSGVEALLADLKSTNASVTNELAKSKSDFDAANSALKSSYERIKTENSALESKLSGAEAELAEQKSNNKSVSDGLAKFKSDFDELSRKFLEAKNAHMVEIERLNKKSAEAIETAKAEMKSTSQTKMLEMKEVIDAKNQEVEDLKELMQIELDKALTQLNLLETIHTG